jgi:hypothetical protein
VQDDRDDLGNDPFVLIVEEDPTLASILLDLARDNGLKGVVSTAGAGTLALARKLRPHAITWTSDSAISTGSCCSTF